MQLIVTLLKQVLKDGRATWKKDKIFKTIFTQVWIQKNLTKFLFFEESKKRKIFYHFQQSVLLFSLEKVLRKKSKHFWKTFFQKCLSLWLNVFVQFDEIRIFLKFCHKNFLFYGIFSKMFKNQKIFWFWYCTQKVQIFSTKVAKKNLWQENQ